MKKYKVTLILLFVFVTIFITSILFFKQNDLQNSSKHYNITIKANLPFKNNSYIPKKYTCDGENINPSIFIENYKELSKKGKYLAVIVEDPDAPLGTFIHWVAYNIPISQVIPENSSRKGLYNETLNDFGYLGYGGPCPPPSETHHYYFYIYLLNKTINTNERSKVIEEIEKNSIAETTIVGLYRRS